MADRQKGGETACVRPLYDRQPEKEHRLQDGGGAADDERHAVEIGDLVERQVERPPEKPWEDEHAGHAEYVLQSQHGKLR